MSKASQARASIDPTLAFRHGVRRDGTPWITYAHSSMGNVIRLSLPSDPEFEKIRVAFFDWEEARKGPRCDPANNQPA